MAVRRIACDPCRRSKLACSHERPICSRCRDREQGDSCIYRPRPFRRRARINHSNEVEETSIEDVAGSIPSNSPVGETINRSSMTSHYPNPGFLGMSSHSTIFNEVSTSTSHPSLSFQDEQPPTSPPPTDPVDDWAISDKAVCALSRLIQIDVPNLVSLVQSWLQRGVNLPLAESFVIHCSEAVSKFTQLSTPQLGSDHSAQIRHQAKVLLENTRKPIAIDQNSSIMEFLYQMVGENIRWESLGIFFVAATRAVLDTCSFAPLYSSDKQRRGLIRVLTYIGDCCLETCLALDCLNDLQLILQYENFIVHSQVDGDQSKSWQAYSRPQFFPLRALLKLAKNRQGYHSWRRMGDVASSLCALGYHERIDKRLSNIPSFLANLRRACFARIYAADKSLAIFLGRPPRIVKEFCFFQLPTHTMDTWNASNTATHNNNTLLSTPRTDREASHSTTDGAERIDYTADTCCSALFASLKEEVLLMLRRRHLADQTQSVREFRLRVEDQWQRLPPHFRLSTSVKDCDRSPFERDFLAGTRLDYLHILLLTGLVSRGKLSEPDDLLLTVAGEMLSITVEVIILRDRLVNSGTSLIWKVRIPHSIRDDNLFLIFTPVNPNNQVAQYGLPAAGIISLALLQPIGPDNRQLPRSKMVQYLSALVAEITIGAWIQTGEPNFALFTRATRTIQSLLDSLMAWTPQVGSYSSHQNQDTGLTEDWNTLINSQPLEFEMDFWASLAEHPTLVG
ncbi:unnamed protein product [Penicillium salamii]|uniref:Zn(2)-C6 fungal-type domain-containing protein n=1 Tax=Penicillium salamii TaxID=1612424 RepID=A0A9W4J3S8_9EURO|nr:unnamed protein product [Penicillium salamii]